MENRVSRDTGKANNFYNILIGLFFLSLVVLFLKPTSAYAAFTATLTEVDSSALGTKTPLILVHGIHGKGAGVAYWQNFVSYFNATSILSNNYKLYKFEYDSDIETVSTIGQYLANEINAKLAGKKIVILAHSMGGLVSRSYLQEHGGDNKIIKLITLATPHHGSPGANDEDALTPLSTNLQWDLVFSFSQFFYNLKSTDWNVVTTINSDKPNRSDLRWDNILDPHISFDVNTWLANLNNNLNTNQAQKIIAYYGYIDPNRSDRLY